MGQTPDLRIDIDLTDYPFISKKKNVIRFPGKDSTAFYRFFEKVDDFVATGSGQINVLHIGGSHVQADMFSHQVRMHLDLINHPYQSGRGFIFPFTVAKTNNPANYKVAYSGKWSSASNVQRNREMSLGMGGIAVYTNDPEAAIYVNLNPGDSITKRWTFNRLRLLGYPEDDEAPIRPVLYYNGASYDSFYDLVTETYIFDLPFEADCFEIGFVSEDSDRHIFIVNGFIPEKDTPGITYHAIGVNGASTVSYLNSEFFEKELAIIAPDLVIFGIGINDAAGKDFDTSVFRANYNELIRRIKTASPQCAFLFITNNDSYKKVSRKKYQVNRNGLLAQEAFYELAVENQGGVWDLFEIMGGLSSMQQWEKAGLAQRDKIHFNRAGYELLGDLLFNAIVELNTKIDSGYQ
jgi:Lysophospholipase L1 and related esterases